MKTFELQIEGMSCGHCVARVRKTLERVPELRVEDVQVGSARIVLADEPAATEHVLAALADAGYPARASLAR